MEKEEIKQLVNSFLESNIFLTPDLIEYLYEQDFEESKVIISSVKNLSKSPAVINKDFFELIKENKTDINFEDLEKLKAMSEKKDRGKYEKAVECVQNNNAGIEGEKKNEDLSNVKILFSYDEKEKSRDMSSFVSYYNEKYKAIEKLLLQRHELSTLTTIQRVLKKKDREDLSFIGMVSDKRYTKNGNLMLTLEDQSGEIKVLVNKNKPDLFREAKDIVFDEVIGVNGVNGQNIVFANSLIWPEVPYKEFKKSSDDCYAIFLSDLHVGSNLFLESEFKRFISWLRGEVGNDKQREIAKGIKYVFIAGDLVDGVGIYPNQESELDITDIYEQYEECAKLLAQIPEYMTVVVCPGNHDAMRLSEPQKEIYSDCAAPLLKLSNLKMVSNPSLINIHSSDEFPGFDILMYHGYSFDYFIANVESLRNNGGYDRADLVMKFLLRRRHLAPTHESTLHSLDEKDHLVIDNIPDFFITGHIHKSSVANYKNITLICGSCWQGKTSFQEKVGHHPEPCRVPIVNLKTREVKILKFGD